jgi:hypothetical protein
MNTMTVEKANAPAASESFLRDALAWWSDTNPRRLACRHLGLAVMWLTLGLVSALILRLEMLTPALDMMQARTFGALLSLHGALMFYFVALPLIPGALGQFLLARWLPDEQVVFPRLNRLAWQLLAVGGMLVAGGFVLGGTEVGWGLEAGFGGRFNQGGTLPLAAGVLCASVSMGLNALNFLAGLRQLRRHGFPGGGARVMAESLGCASLLGVVAGTLPRGGHDSGPGRCTFRVVGVLARVGRRSATVRGVVPLLLRPGPEHAAVAGPGRDLWRGIGSRSCRSVRARAVYSTAGHGGGWSGRMGGRTG